MTSDLSKVTAMPMLSADPVHLSGAQKHQVWQLVRAGTTAQRLVLRARIVLLAAEGLPTEVIARKLRIDPNAARKWRRRWGAAPDVATLGDAARSGRPSPFTAVQIAQVKALACSPPTDCALPLSRNRMR